MRHYCGRPSEPTFELGSSPRSKGQTLIRVKHQKSQLRVMEVTRAVMRIAKVVHGDDQRQPHQSKRGEPGLHRRNAHMVVAEMQMQEVDAIRYGLYFCWLQ